MGRAETLFSRICIQKKNTHVSSYILRERKKNVSNARKRLVTQQRLNGIGALKAWVRLTERVGVGQVCGRRNKSTQTIRIGKTIIICVRVFTKIGSGVLEWFHWEHGSQGWRLCVDNTMRSISKKSDLRIAMAENNLEIFATDVCVPGGGGGTDKI